MDSAGRRHGDRQGDGSSDRRWVILAEDGRHATLGRATDPAEAEIRQAEEQMKAIGAAGWLAVMSGSPYGPELPDLMEVRPLGTPHVTFSDAVAAFRRIHSNRYG